MYEIRHDHPAYRSKAWPLVVEGFNEMIQDGLCEGLLPISADDNVLYTKSPEGDIVGVLCFSRMQVPCEHIFQISLGYVEPSSRRTGVYRALWEHLVSLAKSQVGPVQSIVGTATARNTTAGLVMAALGRKQELITYRYDL